MSSWRASIPNTLRMKPTERKWKYLNNDNNVRMSYFYFCDVAYNIVKVRIPNNFAATNRTALPVEFNTTLSSNREDIMEHSDMS